MCPELAVVRPAARCVAVAAGLLSTFIASLFITADLTTTWLMWVLAGAVVVAAFANTVADPRAAILSRGGLIAACCIAGAGVIFQIMTTYFKRDIPTAKPDDNSS